MSDAKALLEDRIRAGNKLLMAHEERLAKYEDELTWAIVFIGDEKKARELMPFIFEAHAKGMERKRWMEDHIAKLQEELHALG